MLSRTLKAMVFAAAITAIAQAAPNFSGDWKMNIAKSDFGPVPAPEELTRAIQHKDLNLAIKTHQKGAQGDISTELKYTTDGKPCMNKVNGSDSAGTAKFEGDNLVIESTREYQGMQLHTKETWSLSDGGKTLTILNHLAVPQGEFDLKLVLEKQ
ncbi:MAG: hypothetical protein LAO79_13210 [Acidobacteriia bacterium]|nr:hypothetical protein [Terriglobia bacterium]